MTPVPLRGPSFDELARHAQSAGPGGECAARIGGRHGIGRTHPLQRGRIARAKLETLLAVRLIGDLARKREGERAPGAARREADGLTSRRGGRRS